MGDYAMMSDNAAGAQPAEAYFGLARVEIEPLLPERAERVLEIGCGAGGTMRWLRGRRTVALAVGVEMVPAVAEVARGVFDRVECGNVEAMELPGEGFDLILALDVLEHLVDPWRMVARLHAALRPGGTLLISVPNVAHVSVVLPLLFGGRWEYRDAGLLDRTHLRFFTRGSAVGLVTSSGLAVERMQEVRAGWGWLTRLSSAWQWRALRVLGLVLPRWLFDFQFLIAARAPG